MATTEAAIFVDANFFLHFLSIDQIDWCSFSGAKTVYLKIVPVTISELNKQKDTGHNKSIKSRALAALKLLENVVDSTDPYQVRTNVFLEFFTDAHDDFAAYKLDRHCIDDNLLLAAIHFRDENPGIATSLLTADIGFRAKSKHLKLPVLKPLENWKLPPAPDPEQKELAELRARVAALPKLEVRFQNGQIFFESRRPAPPPNDASFVSQVMTKLRQKYSTTGDPAFNPLLQINESIVREYNMLVLQFHKQYEHFLPQWLDTQQQHSRTVTLRLQLFNSGKSPARDARVRLKFPQGKFEIFALGVDAPLPPSPPPKLQSYAPMSLGYEPYADEDLSPPLQHQKDMAFIDVKGSLVELTTPEKKIQHSTSVNLQPIYIQFENYNDMTGFSFECYVMADEVPETRLNDLSVKMTQGGIGAQWHLPLLDN